MNKQLWIEFLRIYDRTKTRMEIKQLYSRNVTLLNIPGCTSCTINHSFWKFMFDVEDMSDDDIQNFLNSNQPIMPVKKTAKKTSNKKAEKAVTKRKPKTIATTEPITTPVAATPTTPVAATPATPTTPTTPTTEVVTSAIKTPQTLPGGIKFFYIPKRK